MNRWIKNRIEELTEQRRAECIQEQAEEEYTDLEGDDMD